MNLHWLAVTRKELERSAWVNTSAEAWRFLSAHPEHMQKYREMEAWNRERQQQQQVGTGRGQQVGQVGTRKYPYTLSELYGITVKK